MRPHFLRKTSSYSLLELGTFELYCITVLPLCFRLRVFGTSLPLLDRVLDGINILGAVMIALWAFAIGNKGYERLLERGIPDFPEVGKFNVSLMTVVLLTSGRILFDTSHILILEIFLTMQLLFILFIVYYCSKAVLSLEKGVPVKAAQIVETMFLFIILPIGLLLLQPRIRKVFQNEEGLKESEKIPKADR